MDLIYKIVSTSEEMKQIFALRIEVFVHEQKVPIDLEMDKDDDKAIHVLVSLDDEAIGCGRIVSNQKHAHIGRVAVKKQWRGKGIGRQLMQFLVKTCNEGGAEDIILHSQVQAIPFYESLGFRVDGDTFLDAGILHKAMKMIF